jgi:hypothetical protein
MLHACAARFDVMGILKTFGFRGELNKAFVHSWNMKCRTAVLKEKK